MNASTIADIVKMPIQQRIQLVEDVWDSIAKLPNSVEIPEWHKQELTARLKSYSNNPNAGSTWQEVKNRVLG